MRSFTSRAICCGLLIVLGLLSALPNLLPESAARVLPAWYVDNKVALGLDLRGGSHLLLEVNTSNLQQDANQQLADTISDALRANRLFHQTPQVDAQSIRIQPIDGSQLTALVALARPLVKAASESAHWYDLDRQDGQLVIRSTDIHKVSLQRDAVERSLEVVRRRLDETGLAEPTIARQGDSSVLVQLPGVDDPQHIRKLLGTTAKMTLHWAADGHRDAVSLPDRDGLRYRLEKRVALEGSHIRDAQLAFIPDTGEPVVNFRLDKEGARRFADMTGNNIGRQLAIVLDGEVITAPVIRSAITGGSGEISGYFTAQTANDLALLLRAGALPAPLDVIEERTVGPDLGSDAIAMGLATGLMGAALVFVFMLGIYGRWGLIACAALAINIGLVFGVLSVLGATLTLPGIAGLILSVGMAVDANILINERIREEARRGHSAAAALNAGFKRAFGTILDSNITTLIAVSLLFMFGSGPVRGFAVTMAVGLVTSMFTAISVTRLVMEWQVRRRGHQPLQINGIKALDRLSDRSINFMRGRFIGIALSAALSVASIFLFVKPGLEFGVDFSGGSVIEVRAPATSVEALREALQQHDLRHAAIQEFGGAGSFLVRLPMENAEGVASGASTQAVKDAIGTVAADAEFLRVEMVGPRVSGDFSEATLLAILLAGGGMLVFLWLRFEAHFATAAILTLALDLTKTIGFFVLAGIEFNLTAVAALLALIGYSVNDKIVVFDRIRENLRLDPDRPLPQLLNDSISSTLTRTTFTSATTFLALLPMAVAGGSAVASFSLPMLFGIIIGTSSSIFIAAPIVLWLGQRRLKQGRPQLRPSAEQIQRQLEQLP